MDKKSERCVESFGETQLLSNFLNWSDGAAAALGSFFSYIVESILYFEKKNKKECWFAKGKEINYQQSFALTDCVGLSLTV